MAFPPTAPPQRTNGSAVLDNHPNDHNLLASNIADLTTRLTSSAWGIIPGGLTTLTASHTAITATTQPGTAINGAVCNVTTVAGRRYKITWNGNPYGDAANASVVGCILRDGILIQNRAAQIVYASIGHELVITVIDVPTAGAHTYTVSYYRNAGSGNINNYADNVGAPCQLTVEDIGPTAPTV